MEGITSLAGGLEPRPAKKCYATIRQEGAMDDTFAARVRGAAVAAWWTLLIAFGFLMLQWVVYLQVMSAKPEWAASFWRPGATWASINAVWFFALVVVKLTLWPLLLCAVWLTSWARQLRKRKGGA